MGNEYCCSVIIPAFQCEKYIEECIASAQSQTISNIEILVIDDYSLDNTAKIIRRMAESDARIRFLQQENNLGVAAARNRGIIEARSDWVAFLDSDDKWLPDKLEKQMDLQHQTGADLLYTGAQCMDANEILQDRYYEVPASITYESLLFGNCIVCSSVLVRQRLMIENPMKHSELHEDYICWLELLKKGCKARGCQQFLTIYRISQTSKSANKISSAYRTWRVLKYMEVSFLKRCFCFMAYAVHGIKRHWL